MPVLLTDFGLARLAETGSRLTSTGQALGTPRYMSPEQARGEGPALTPATDTWALGIVLYECLTGRTPFDAPTPAAIIGLVLTAPAPCVRASRPDVPAVIEAVIGQALAKRAGDRYPDARALRDDCDRLLRGERPTARLPRRRAPLVGAALVVAVAVGGVAVQDWRHRAATTGGSGPSDGGAARPGPGEALAARGRAARIGDPRAAAAAFEAALREAPDRHDWRVELGLARWASGDATGARAAWTTVPDGTPESVSARLWEGLEATTRLDGHVVLRVCGALAAEPGREGRVARASVASVRRRWADARAALAGLDGPEIEMLRALIETWAPDGDRHAADRAYDAAMAGGLRSGWLASNRGNARADRDDHAGAIRDYDAAIALEPAESMFWLNRAKSRHALGDDVAARADADAAVERAGADPEPWSYRADLRRQAGDVAGAGADLERAAALGSTDASHRFNLGSWRLDRGDRDGALAEFEAALAADPDHLKARMGRGIVRRARGDVAGATADYDAILARDPDHDWARTNRGLLRRETGDAAGAVEDLRHAARLQPERPESHLNLALALADAGDAAAAAVAMRAFLRLAPDHRRAAGMRAILAQLEAAAKG